LILRQIKLYAKNSRGLVECWYKQKEYMLNY